MKHVATAYAAMAVVFLGLDVIWLGIVSVDIYKQGIGHLLAEKPDFGAAAAFYVIYLAGAVYFAVMPALLQQKPGRAFRDGALFGLVAYATYDLTNQATMRDWPVSITIIDLVWGSFATSFAASAATWITLKVTRPSQHI